MRHDTDNSNLTEDPECDHKGKHNPVSSTVIAPADGVLVITSHNCSNCGHVFIKVTDLGKQEKQPPRNRVISQASPLFC